MGGSNRLIGVSESVGKLGGQPEAGLGSYSRKKVSDHNLKSPHSHPIGFSETN
jgi:hypothetical protein